MHALWPHRQLALGRALFQTERGRRLSGPNAKTSVSWLSPVRTLCWIVRSVVRSFDAGYVFRSGRSRRRSALVGGFHPAQKTAAGSASDGIAWAIHSAPLFDLSPRPARTIEADTRRDDLGR